MASELARLRMKACVRGGLSEHAAANIVVFLLNCPPVFCDVTVEHQQVHFAKSLFHPVADVSCWQSLQVRL